MVVEGCSTVGSPAWQHIPKLERQTRHEGAGLLGHGQWAAGWQRACSARVKGPQRAEKGFATQVPASLCRRAPACMPRPAFVGLYGFKSGGSCFTRGPLTRWWPKLVAPR